MATTLYFFDYDNQVLINSIPLTGVLANARGICYMGQGQFIACANQNWSWFHVTEDLTALYETKQVNALHLQLRGTRQAFTSMCTDGVDIYVTFNFTTTGEVPQASSSIAHFKNDGTFIRELTSAFESAGYTSITYDGVFFYTGDAFITKRTIRQWEFQSATGTQVNFANSGGVKDVISSIEYNGFNFYTTDNNAVQFIDTVGRDTIKVGPSFSTGISNIQDSTFISGEEFVNDPDEVFFNSIGNRILAIIAID